MSTVNSPYNLTPLPEPSDPPSNGDVTMADSKIPKISFKEILTNKPQNLNKSYSHLNTSLSNEDTADDDPISFTNLEKERIYHPWK